MELKQANRETRDASGCRGELRPPFFRRVATGQNGVMRPFVGWLSVHLGCERNDCQCDQSAVDHGLSGLSLFVPALSAFENVAQPDVPSKTAVQSTRQSFRVMLCTRFGESAGV